MEVTCEDVKARLDAGDGFLLLDCREQSEWDGGHIDGAMLMPMSAIRDRLDELDEWKGGNIVVYCHHGGRSLRVTGFLRQNGFPQTWSMAGGIDQWSVQIDPSIPRY
ncbi:MAG: rhodanese-like domain-containing protein [Planctomycetaceae bacterium]|nr:rhodanese-like domain-containing protein [Planctomycetaceae bacterium]